MDIKVEEIKKKIEAILEEIILVRRDLHSHPELSGCEKETEFRITKFLKELKIPYENNIAGHGVSAVIYGHDKDHAVDIRADIDALPLLEKSPVSFISQNPGVMRACGHDVHTAILLGTAKVLSSISEELPKSVRLLFQPCEETTGGAQKMIDAGCLTSPAVKSVIGLHVDPSMDAGHIKLVPGAANAASSEFYVTVLGESCHAAHPDNGVDPLLPACQMVSALQSIISQKIDPTDRALLTVGQLHSGNKNNIIPSEAKFSGVIRTLEDRNQSIIKEKLLNICTSIASAYGAGCHIEFINSYPILENDPFLLGWVKEVGENALGPKYVHVIRKPSLGTDDFSYFCHGTRGLYYDIGVRKPGEKNWPPLHSEFFAVDETCISIGILTEVLSVLKIMEEESKE